VSKVSVVVAAGVGYVLGARAGRGRYEQIMAAGRQVWHDPRVQRQAAAAVEVAKDKAPDVGAKVADAARSAVAKVSSVGSDETDDPTPRDEMGRSRSDAD
jgi:SLT domain-containing protein